MCSQVLSDQDGTACSDEVQSDQNSHNKYRKVLKVHFIPPGKASCFKQKKVANLVASGTTLNLTPVLAEQLTVLVFYGIGTFWIGFLGAIAC